MIEPKIDITDEHAENSNAVTRKMLLESLHRNIQEVLNFNIRKYNGRSGKEVRKWLWDNDYSLIGAFNLLLSDEAVTLWKIITSETTTREWFLNVFTV